MNNAPTSRHDKHSRSYAVYAALLAAIMFVGFAKNYYLRVWLGTRAITTMVHVHGLVMTAWVALFVTQTLLVANRRVDLHRKLGPLGAILAGVVVALGIYTTAASIRRHHIDTSAKMWALAFVAFDGLSLLLFAGLVLSAFLLKSRPQFHKRLMLMAMVALLPPAFGRFVAYFTHDHIGVIVLLLMVATAFSCVIVDVIQNRRLHPAFAWSASLVILINLATYFAQISL